MFFLNTEPQARSKFLKVLIIIGVFIAAAALVLAGIFAYTRWQEKQLAGQKFSASTFVMDTLVTQEAYGANAQKAMQEVNLALADYQDRFSLFVENSDISRVNASAGGAGVQVAPETAALLRQSLALSAQSEGAFAVSIAPLTLAWGVTSNTPRVVPQSEIDTLLPLVDDSKVKVEGDVVTLDKAGMGLDLGGIAKGAACSVVQDIYEKDGVESALLSIGGNIYVKGTKPDGSQYRIGFRDPTHDEASYIASFYMQDQVMAVSGGYERFFEQDGKTYIHIMDPRTGCPAESDIVSVGAVDKDGAVADFYSTTLFVWGKERTLQYMRSGGAAIMLDGNNNLYVSASLQDGFEMHDVNGAGYTLHFVAAEE